jgi:glycosyltransferase involved in cell wall biosynthesis
MSSPEKISAVLIALDEERHIEAALKSVAWADEVLVVDGGSTDQTIQKCRALGARVVEHPFTSYTDQKNRGLDEASHPWVLSVDADERVTEALADEIGTLAQSGFQAAGYRIPRVSYYLGRFIRSTAWYPDHQLRLFDRRRGRWQGKYVHESVRIDGRVDELEGEMLHYSYENISDHVERLNHYAGLAALQMQEAGRKGSLVQALVYPPLVFLKNYIVKAGFTDGSVGLVVSFMNSYYVFLKYLMLWEIERDDSTRSDRIEFDKRGRDA